MQINHPKVKKIVQQTERRIKKLTGNESLLVVVLNYPAVTISFEQIEEVVCQVRDIDTKLLYSKTRKRAIVLTRHLVAHYGQLCAKMTLKAIAEKLGGKDHTTVISNLKRIRALIETGDDLVFYDVKVINKKLEALSAELDKQKNISIAS